MPRRYTNIGIHPVLTPASKASQVEIEHLDDDAIAYRLNDGPRRVISPAPYGIYNVLRQLSAVVAIEHRAPEEVESIAYLERELHEDIIAYEQGLIDRENARLYSFPYPPSLVRECTERRRFRVDPYPGTSSPGVSAFVGSGQQSNRSYH